MQEVKVGQEKGAKLPEQGGNVKNYPRLPKNEDFNVRKSLTPSEKRGIEADCLSFQIIPKTSYEDVISVLRDYKWKPIPWVIDDWKYLPFGYKLDEERAKNEGYFPTSVLYPIIEDLQALEIAKHLLKTYTKQSVWRWLKQKTGKNISYDGFNERLNIDRRREQRESYFRKQAIRLAKALISAKKIAHDECGATFTEKGRKYDEFGRKIDKNKFDGVDRLFQEADPWGYVEKVNKLSRD